MAILAYHSKWVIFLFKNISFLFHLIVLYVIRFVNVPDISLGTLFIKNKYANRPSTPQTTHSASQHNIMRRQRYCVEDPASRDGTLSQLV